MGGVLRQEIIIKDRYEVTCSEGSWLSWEEDPDTGERFWTLETENWEEI